jgi:hypothetical protein
LRVVEIADRHLKPEELRPDQVAGIERAGDGTEQPRQLREPRVGAEDCLCHAHDNVRPDAFEAHLAAAHEKHLRTQGDALAIDHEPARARPALMQAAHRGKGR